MSLQEQVAIEITDAMKAKNAEKLATLRGLKTALQNESIKLQQVLTAEQELIIVSREVKQTKEELAGYKAATGDYSATILKLENRIQELTRFLPQQLTTEEVETIIQQIIASIGATTKGDMGKVMAAVMPKLKGKADGKLINQTVAKLLS